MAKFIPFPFFFLSIKINFMEKMYFKIGLTLGYIILGYLLIFLLQKISKILIFGAKKIQNESLVRKTKTLKSFIDSIIYAVVAFVILFFILELWDVNITPLLTGAGILGLAASFGAQTLIKDLISGFFIIFENQFNVGDEVKIGAFQGKVKKINLRQTILEDKKGNLIFIPNSQITTLVKLKKEE